jgi:hypothetical protein
VDWLSFIAAITSSLAWPTAVVVLALGFRKALLALIPDVQEVGYGKFKVTFERKLSEAKERAATAQLPPVPAEEIAQVPHAADPGAEGNELPEEFKKLAIMSVLSPKATVLDAWTEVEQALQEASRRVNLGPVRRGERVQRLIEANGTTQDIGEIVRTLETLRNDAAHQPDPAIDAGTAMNYALLARRVAASLRGEQGH